MRGRYLFHGSCMHRILSQILYTHSMSYSYERVSVFYHMKYSKYCMRLQLYFACVISEQFPFCREIGRPCVQTHS
jgi:hypothetical protein